MAGNRPSGSRPDSVKASVWQTPVATILTRTSPVLGAATSTSSIDSGRPAAQATAALDFTAGSPRSDLRVWCGRTLLLGFRVPALAGTGGPLSLQRLAAG